MFSRTSHSTGPGSAEITGFYDSDTGSIQYVVADPETGKAALIDVVQDFDPANARTSFSSAQQIMHFVAEKGLQVEWVLDTHPHADHLMASYWLSEKTGAPNGIGEKVADVAELWRGLYNLPEAFDVDDCFHRLFKDGDTFSIGSLPVHVMLSPGHTLASITYVVGSDAAFVHDTLMHVDFGTARADFPGGSSRELYGSLMTILGLPDETRLFIGHDYGTKNRDEPAWEATVAVHRENNVHIGGDVSEAEFVKLRDERDNELGLPDRMLFALQVNLRAGQLPNPEEDGNRYFKIPANRF